MTQFYWHIHHDVLVEPLLEPIENRIAFIRKHKPPYELETRRRLMQPVRGELPESILQAGAVLEQVRAALEQVRAVRYQAKCTYDKAQEQEQARAALEQARAACEQAWVARGQAWAAYEQVLRDEMPALEALHAAECPDCPWDGHTIFPEVRRNEQTVEQ